MKQDLIIINTLYLTSDYPTFNKEWDKDEPEKKTKKMLKEIGELKYKMYAQNKHSIIVVLQGTDASGKDGLTSGFQLQRNVLRYGPCFP